MQTKSHFNPNWVVHNRFADGYLQGVRLDKGDIELRADDYRRAAYYNITGYWTPERVTELECEIAQALAKVEAR